ETLVAVFDRGVTIGSFADVCHGLTTVQNRRFVRFWWERHQSARWRQYSKGEGFRKFTSKIYHLVDWQDGGARVRVKTLEQYPYLNEHAPWVLQSKEYYFKEGVTYSTVAGGRLSARRLRESIFDVGSAGIFCEVHRIPSVLALLNSRTANVLARALCPNLN